MKGSDAAARGRHDQEQLRQGHRPTREERPQLRQAAGVEKQPITQVAENSLNCYFQEGTKTAERGARANKHVHREILELIEVIYMSGFPVDGAEDEHVSVMFFGDLFRLADRIRPCGSHGK